MTQVTAETNLNGKKERATPIPKDGKRITEGALKLPLDQRVALRNELTKSIDEDLDDLEFRFNEAKKLVGKE